MIEGLLDHPAKRSTSGREEAVMGPWRKNVAGEEDVKIKNLDVREVGCRGDRL